LFVQSVARDQLQDYHHDENADSQAESSSPVVKKNDNDKNTPVQPVEPTSSLNPLEKRLRNLKKKLQQIENLKEKQKKGEVLEETQVRTCTYSQIFHAIYRRLVKQSIVEIIRQARADAGLFSGGVVTF